MDKAFFESLQDRTTSFAERSGGDGDVRVELTLVTGRTFVVSSIVEVGDGWLQVDGHDAHEETITLSMIVPFHQISFAALAHQKAKSRTGIRPAGF